MGRPIFALIIGVNQYRCNAIFDLHGCTKDAECVRAMLIQLSHGTAQIRYLVDKDATQAGILQAFDTHLTNNTLIQRDDPIVVYFAGHGRRLEGAAYGIDRDVDILLPHDCDGSTLGISDFTMHTLLCDLAQEKGSNITFIMDTSFSSFVPRGKIMHRSDMSPPPRPDAFISWRTGSKQSPGFYSPDRTPYVLLAACSEDQLANESSDGGTFTHALLVEIQRQPNQTYREVCAALELESQIPICSGLHFDQLLFSIAPNLRIPKLRVFVDSPIIVLEIHENHDFVQVRRKSNANIALSSNTDGNIVIERLDGLVAAYARRKVTAPGQDSRSIALMLNKIARFNYYLYVKPPHPASWSLWRQIFSWVSGRRRKAVLMLYHLMSEEPGMLEVDQKRGNLLKSGVARLDRTVTGPDNFYGMKIINSSNRTLYPSLLYFDPGSYSIMPIHWASRNVMDLVPSQPRLQRGSSFILGLEGGPPLRFTPNPDDDERDAGFFKLFMFTSATDVSYIRQDSALNAVEEGAVTAEPPSFPAGHSTFCGTNMATVALGSSGEPLGSWRKSLSRSLRRVGI